MSVDPKQLQKNKVIGFKVTEDELQNTIYPVMHDCYQLGIIDHDTLTSFLRFCLQFWISHYHMKKQQFEMSQQEIDAEKEAWYKWDNSTPRVIEKATKELEAMGEQLERESKLTQPQPQPPQQQPPKPKQQQSPLAN